MGIVINVNSYGTAYDAMEAQYGEEIMCAGWNPTVALVCQQQLPAPTERQTTMPVDFVTADVELFLQQMYVHQL